MYLLFYKNLTKANLYVQIKNKQFQTIQYNLHGINTFKVLKHFTLHFTKLYLTFTRNRENLGYRI